MAVELFRLPPDKTALANIMQQHVARCESTYMARRTTWLLAWYYFNGYRRFDVYNPASGAISPHFLDEEGNMEHSSQELLFAINQVAGRIQGMDIRMKVDSQGFSLGAIRDRAVAQVIGDSILSDQQLRTTLDDFSWTFACLGFAGVTGHVVDHPTIGLTGDMQVLHPKELFPFPLAGDAMTGTGGLTRVRWVPVDYLKDIYGKQKIAACLDEMHWIRKPIGEPIDQEDRTPSIHYWGNRQTIADDSDDTSTGIAKIYETWQYGPQNTVAHYVCGSGDKIFQSQDLRNNEVYCPVGYSRFMNNGTFHGAGMFDLMYPIHRQLELLQKSLFNNIRDLDRYGILVLPQGQMNQNMMLKEVGRGLRTLFWEPDPVSEGFNPFPIQPFNSGDMPGRVAQFAKDAMASVNPIQDLVKEKGRVDSATGLQFLDESINKALTTPSNGVATAFGNCYRSMVQKALQKLTVSPRTIPVSNLTLELAGAIIDPTTLEVSFSRNPLPRISGLKFTVRELSPRSQVARKQEAVQLWQSKIEQDPLAFRMFALKEGLDFAMWSDEDKGAYESGILTILMLYGDGEENNQVVLTPHTTRPEIMLRLCNAFMNSPLMAVAKPGIINDFGQLRMTLLNYMGLSLPSAIPNPDDAAALMQQLPPGADPSQPPTGAPQGKSSTMRGGPGGQGQGGGQGQPPGDKHVHLHAPPRQ